MFLVVVQYKRNGIFLEVIYDYCTFFLLITNKEMKETKKRRKRTGRKEVRSTRETNLPRYASRKITGNFEEFTEMNLFVILLRKVRPY